MYAKHIYVIMLYFIPQDDLVDLEQSNEAPGDDDEVDINNNGSDDNDTQIAEIRGPTPPPSAPTPGPSVTARSLFVDEDQRKEPVSQTLKKMVSNYQEKRVEDNNGREPKKGLNVKKSRKESPIDAEERERTQALNKMVDVVQGAMQRESGKGNAPTANDLWCDNLKTQLNRMSQEV